jgi:hypothetical protein
VVGGRLDRDPDAERPWLSPSGDGVCEDCETAPTVAGAARCPACFDRRLYDIETGFLDSYRRFGCRSRLVVAEACLRALVLESPDHRKALAMTILEQYVNAAHDLAALYRALLDRGRAPVLRSFLDFRLDAASALAFYEGVERRSDAELCSALGLPLPARVAEACPHLNEEDAYSLTVSIYHLLSDLRRATAQGARGALALAEMTSRMGGAVITPDAAWLNGDASTLTPDQVAMLVLDSRRRSIHVHGISAEERSMGEVVDAIDTVTRASSNLIYAYLQTHDL